MDTQILLYSPHCTHLPQPGLEPASFCHNVRQTPPLAAALLPPSDRSGCRQRRVIGNTNEAICSMCLAPAPGAARSALTSAAPRISKYNRGKVITWR